MGHPPVAWEEEQPWCPRVPRSAKGAVAIHPPPRSKVSPLFSLESSLTNITIIFIVKYIVQIDSSIVLDVRYLHFS